MGNKKTFGDLIKQAKHTERRYEIVHDLKDLSKVEDSKFYIIVE